MAFVALVAIACAFLLYKDKINLGLDLQGGIHMVLQVDVDQALQAEVQQFREQIDNEFASRKVTYDQTRVADGKI
ncbi:MAG: protein translocase subunit SecD, partial [Acidobacteriota bacterium]